MGADLHQCLPLWRALPGIREIRAIPHGANDVTHVSANTVQLDDEVVTCVPMQVCLYTLPSVLNAILSFLSSPSSGSFFPGVGIAEHACTMYTHTQINIFLHQVQNLIFTRWRQFLPDIWFLPGWTPGMCAFLCEGDRVKTALNVISLVQNRYPCFQQLHEGSRI